jgi:hypothetical protein
VGHNEEVVDDGGVDTAIINLSFGSLSRGQKLIPLATASAFPLITLRVVRVR